MILTLTYPAIDPVALSIGPIAVRWYALAYVAGLVLGWRYVRWLARRRADPIDPRLIDDFVFWATLGVVLGGRLGFVLFYQPAYYLAHPVEILLVWQGGMSFHGGALGVVVALILFARQRALPVWRLADLVACAAPIGLFFGRLANFVNGELYGRVSDAPWAMVFPGAGALPRHPSQLYEAALEGMVLFVVLALVGRRVDARAHAGVLTGTFIAGYGLARFVVELFREPDAHLGLLAAGLTMGQILSLPMLAVGIGAIVWALGRRTAPRPR